MTQGEDQPPSAPIEEEKVVTDLRGATSADVEKTREEAREYLGWGILILASVTVIGGPVLALADMKVWDQFSQYYDRVLTVDFTLLASLVGYYYGRHKA